MKTKVFVAVGILTNGVDTSVLVAKSRKKLKKAIIAECGSEGGVFSVLNKKGKLELHSQGDLSEDVINRAYGHIVKEVTPIISFDILVFRGFKYYWYKLIRKVTR